ncbi:MAG: hypothetical protein ABF288_12265, partial [Octadecabacter sp.]
LAIIAAVLLFGTGSVLAALTGVGMAVVAGFCLMILGFTTDDLLLLGGSFAAVGVVAGGCKLWLYLDRKEDREAEEAAKKPDGPFKW